MESQPKLGAWSQGPRSILRTEGAKTFWGARHAENQGQDNFSYRFKYIVEIIWGGAIAPSASRFRCPCLELENKYLDKLVLDYFTITAGKTRPSLPISGMALFTV